MRKGAKSFAGFAVVAVPAIVVFCGLTGSGTGLLALLGVFYTLSFCNRLDRRLITDE